MEPKLSIIIPVYNSEKYLVRCINSLMEQELEGCEFIFVNDGSSDSSLKILNKYKNLDARIIVITQENKGVSVARNTGINIAGGNYVTFVDSDDYIETNMYNDMMRIADEYSCDIVMCDCVKEYSDHLETYSHDIRSGYYDEKQLIQEYYQHLLMMENVEYPPTISNWLCLIKRNILVDNHLKYVEGIRFSEDLLFGSQVMRNVKSFYYLKNSYYYHYCMNPQSATHKCEPNKWNDYKKLYKEIDNYFCNDKLFDFRKQIDYCLLFFIYNSIGDIHSVKSMSKRRKKNKIVDILNDSEVRKLFKRINIINIPIPLKQKIITWCYKYKIGLGMMIDYYN